MIQMVGCLCYLRLTPKIHVLTAFNGLEEELKNSQFLMYHSVANPQRMREMENPVNHI